MPQLVQKLVVGLRQKLIITPQLQQAIKLLQLSKLDLQEEISQELVENPALEEAGTTTEMSAPGQDQPESGTPASDASSVREVTAGDEGERKDEDFDFSSYFRDLEDSYQPMRGVTEFRSAEDLPSIEQVLKSQDNLSGHLTWQLEMTLIGEETRLIGEAIIGNLDEGGYLEASLEEVAALSRGDEPWDLDLVEKVRNQIQRFDPVGVASLDLKECLLVQLQVAGHGDSTAVQIIREHLDLLQKKRYEDIEKAMGLSPEELDELLEVIRQLDPRPGEKYNPQTTTYITPDVYVIKDADEYRVLLNDDGLPRLRISPAYKRMLAELKQGDGDDPQAKSFVTEKVKAAFRLIRSLEERQRTIYKVANSIIKFQRPFLDAGIKAIKPLVLRDVAEDIGMHESTVSRVVNQKYMHTPRGLFEMRFFFHSGLASRGGENVSSLTVKEKIRKMVEEENPKKPYSDQALAEALRLEGLQIARRTVAKYREELRIPSSTQRKRAR